MTPSDAHLQPPTISITLCTGYERHAVTKRGHIMDEERTQKIRDRAHVLWEQAGRPHGQDAEHWSQAEQEIAAEEIAPSSAPAATATRSVERKPRMDVAEVADASKAKKGRSKAAGLVSAEAPGTTKGRKPKAVADTGAEAPKAARGRKTKAASDEAAVNSAETTGGKPQAGAPEEGDAPKAKQGRKPKVATEGSTTTE
jgi:hypothetical protein